jgi:hypothetical protein
MLLPSAHNNHMLQVFGEKRVHWLAAYTTGSSHVTYKPVSAMSECTCVWFYHSQIARCQWLRERAHYDWSLVSIARAHAVGQQAHWHAFERVGPVVSTDCTRRESFVCVTVSQWRHFVFVVGEQQQLDWQCAHVSRIGACDVRRCLVRDFLESLSL